MLENEAVLELKAASKSFGETRALNNVYLALREGEVHALIGENGAGKSTLVKILSGAYQMDHGVIWVKGRACVIDSPLAARAHGIAMIYQELALAPHLTVEENMTLGLEESSWGVVKSQKKKIQKALELLGHPNLSPDTLVSHLGAGHRQLVEIGRALISGASIIIMDEPTSSLTTADTQALFAAIKRLKQTGISFIYISHFIEEVQEIADSFSVLRDGEKVGEGAMSKTTIPQLIQMMVGRPLTDMFPKSPHPVGEFLLKVQGAEGFSLPKGVFLELHRGEILGIAGLVGSGRTETLRALFGLDRARGGSFSIAQKGWRGLSSLDPSEAITSGMDFLSENRKEEGLAVGMSVGNNITLSSLGRFAALGGFGFLGLEREKQRVEHWIEELGVRCQGSGQKVGNLSGGNQQKVALARLMERDGDILLLDEPTRGVDVGSKVEIYRLIHRLAAQGKGIIFVSSYLPELLGVCDSLAVMHRGRLGPARKVEEWNEQEIMKAATLGK